MNSSKLLEAIILTTILIVALFFRFYQLDRIPVAFEPDEMAEALDAIDMQQNGLRVFSTSNKGREPLFTYLLVAAFNFWEPQALIFRLIGALAGTIAVVYSYFLTKEMFREALTDQAKWLAALTALGMATGYWQIHHTRMGLRHVLLPPLIAVTFYYLWRGFRTGKRGQFAIAGLFLGIQLYSYPASRFVPIFLLIFFLVEGLLQRFWGRPAAPTLWRQHWQNLLALGATAAIITLPLGYYFVFQSPEQFARRAGEISVFNAGAAGDNLLVVLAKTISGNIAGFAFKGDEHGQYNLPGRPMFGPLMAVALLIGFLVAAYRFKQRPYLFVLLWIPLLLMPAFLVYDRIPAFKRAIGIAPGIYILPALAWVALFDWLKRFRRPWLAAALGVLLPLAVYTTEGVSAYQDYFLRWGMEQPFYANYEPYQEIARLMHETGAENQVWLFPTDRRNKVHRYHRLIDFPYYLHLPDRASIRTDEKPTMFADLSAALAGKSQVVLADIKIGQEWEADHKHILPFLLEKYGRRETVRSTPTYQLSYYTLDRPDLAPVPAQKWEVVNANFGNALVLSRFSFGDASGTFGPAERQTPSGETAWVVLAWRPADQEIVADYQASVRLVDKHGNIVAQTDNPLFDSWHQRTSQWLPGVEVLDYYLLTIQPGTAPGVYKLNVVVYDPTSFQPIPYYHKDQVHPAADLGSLTITPAIQLPTLSAAAPLHIAWAKNLQLVGHSGLPDTPLLPGDFLVCSLIWDSQDIVQGDQTFSLILESPDTGPIPLQTDILVGGEDYPTSAWRSKEVIAQRLSLPIPPTLPGGAYTMVLLPGEHPLGQLNVVARAHQFSTPETIQFPLNLLLGDQIKLIGYNSQLSDETLTLQLYWQAADLITTSYKVFVHVLDVNGNIVAQHDQVPMANQAPTTSWIPGEVIEDTYTFSLPPGTYDLAIGMYNPATGARLKIPNLTNNQLLFQEAVKVQ